MLCLIYQAAAEPVIGHLKDRFHHPLLGFFVMVA